MSKIQNADTVQIDRQSYILLAIAALLLIFANGRCQGAADRDYNRPLGCGD